MALIDNATLMPATARYYIAPVGTAYPANEKKPATPWVELGHTALSDPITFLTEGGETVVKGTLQAPSLRTSVKPVIDGCKIKLQQFDKASLKLFFGSTTAEADGRLQPSSTPKATEQAFLAVVMDGDAHLVFYAKKASIFRDGTPEMSAAEDYASLPLEVKFLNHEGAASAFEIKPLG